MAIQESDEDKRLLTCKVLESTGEYKKGETVICGRYALYQLTLKDQDYFFIHEDDIIGTTDYSESSEDVLRSL
jgi:co-chaperonin GroES (HSP10)|tara:strand:+ start:2327 stop:2545 length:219 start_codon:yes stop_codon:yes gene_type:complete